MATSTWQRTPLFIALFAAPSLALAQAENSPPPALPTVVVHGTEASVTPLLTRGVQAQRQQLARTPGGTNLIQVQEKNRLQSLQDALGSEPGIVLQEFFGGLDQPRLSIRGSGIQSNPVNRGVLLLQDGLPLNEADGSFVISTLEPRNSALIAVRRGGNAENPSATTLGGELDFQSVVADQANSISVNGGSFGRKSLSAGLGGKGEYWDGRIFVSHD